ncbi:COG3014 family protein [Alloalcanivorax sp. C16-2]|uniref:COG3014 family protein n=1 Tax=Alloalcanivorax sp. C16-2 TaxID=3390052 RepID=UPI0039705707
MIWSFARNTLLCLLGAALLSGCATRSLFQPYPDQARGWKSGLGAGAAPTSLLDKGADSADGVLYLQELGRVTQLDGDIDGSRAAFDRVFEHYRETDEAARLRATGLVTGAGALMVNDNALPYVAPDYERIYAHAYQALNYWQSDDVTGTAVELRAAAEEQRVAAARHEREIARAEQEADRQGIDPDRLDGYFAGLDVAAGTVKASFQNAWTFYLSALFWEAHGEYNDALVDYKKALEIHPGADWIKEDVTRVSRALDGRYPRGQGMVAVLYEQGYVPPRREISLPIPTPHGIFAVAFPTYDAADKPAPRSLTVRAEGGEQASTGVLTDVGGLAARHLREQVPAMLVRQALRATGKYNLQKKANDDFGPVGAFLTQLFNLVSERADLRTWLSLPAYGQAARLMLPPGEHRLQLSTPGGGASLTVPVVERGLTVIHVVALPDGLLTRVLPVQEGSL